MKRVVVLKAALGAGMRVTADLFSFLSVARLLREDYRVLFKSYKDSMPRKCIIKMNNFCCVCGDVMFAVPKNALSLYYFGMKIGEEDKTWAPHICCKSCAVSLLLPQKWMFQCFVAS